MPENENYEIPNEASQPEPEAAPPPLPSPQGESPTALPPPVINRAVGVAHEAFEKVAKQVRDASGVAMLIAAINILIGAAITFLAADFVYDILEGAFAGTTHGVYFVIPGLVYLALSIGIYFRSRICALMALVVFAVDSFLVISNTGFENMGVGALVMRAGLLIALVLGIFACLKYHSLRKRHNYTTDETIAAIVQTYKARMNIGRILGYVAIGAIGIAALAYAASTGVFASGRGFDTWHEHQFVNITVRVPSANVVEETEVIPGIPGTAISATSETRAVFVELIAYTGIRDEVPDVADDVLFEFGTELLVIMLDASGAVAESSRSGTMPGGIGYYEVTGTSDGTPFSFRTFVAGDDVYVIGLFVERESDMDLFDSFFGSVVIGR